MNKVTQAALTVAGMAAVAISTQVSAKADTYTVKAGDTLSKIARESDTTVSSLAAINDIQNVDLIFVDDEIETTGTVATAAPVVESSAAVVSEAPVVESSAAVVSEAPVVESSVAAVSEAPAASSVATQTVTTNDNSATQTTTNTVSEGSVYDQFISAGGTQSLWTSIVMPESGGNPNASNGIYHGLGQTNQSWGYGSVASQTAGMINYAVTRYGSIDAAVAFRLSNGWW